MSGINQVKAVFFSATGTTEKTVMKIAGAAAEKLGCPSALWILPCPKAGSVRWCSKRMIW